MATVKSQTEAANAAAIACGKPINTGHIMNVKLSDIILRLAFLAKTQDLLDLLIKFRVEGIGRAINFNFADDDDGGTALIRCVQVSVTWRICQLSNMKFTCQKYQVSHVKCTKGYVSNMSSVTCACVTLDIYVVICHMSQIR